MFTVKDPKTDIANSLSLKEKRAKAIEETPAKPLEKTYQVNESAHALHPMMSKAIVKEIITANSNCKIIVLKSVAPSFPYFKAGNFVTLSVKKDGQIITRPYSIYSSPKEALKGILKLGIQSAGLLSNYVNYELKVGTTVLVGEPSGDFNYDNIRDHEHILAIAGGSGVTPFVSMMKAIMENSDDFKITLLYGVKTLKDMMFNIDDFKDERIKIIPVISDEKVANYEHGFISADIIKKHYNNKTSIFICGPDVMYRYIKGELKKLSIPLSSVRFEHNCAKDLDIKEVKTFNLTVHMRDAIYKIKAKENETLLVAMERANLLAPSRCRAGWCGFCHSRLISGKYFSPRENEHRRLADFKFKYIHPCSTYPTSDMEIDVPPYDELKGE